MSQNCPQCGNPTSELRKIDTSLKVALESTGQASGLPHAVCVSCYETLSAQVSRGVKIRMEEEVKHKNKIKLWKNRVSYVKQGRMYLSQKALPEAAMSFEKYIKVLEVIYDVKPGQLTPETFSKSNRSKEMTVITSVYWDLIRIYDASPRYRDRMSKSVDKLLMFAKYSTIFPAIVKKAEAFSRGCKNKDEVKRLIKSSRSGRSCFIATAVYGHEDHPKIDILRQYRDQVLQQTPPGRSFIKFYYQYSPFLSRKIQRHPVLKKILRPPLDQITLFAAKYLEKKHQKIDV